MSAQTVTFTQWGVRWIDPNAALPSGVIPMKDEETARRIAGAGGERFVVRRTVTRTTEVTPWSAEVVELRPQEATDA